MLCPAHIGSFGPLASFWRCSKVSFYGRLIDVVDAS